MKTISINIKKLEEIESKLFRMQKAADKMINEYVRAYGYKNIEKAQESGDFEEDETYINLNQILGGIGGAIDNILQ